MQESVIINIEKSFMDYPIITDKYGLLHIVVNSTYRDARAIQELWNSEVRVKYTAEFPEQIIYDDKFTIWLHYHY